MRTGLALAVRMRFVLAAACLVVALAVVGWIRLGPGGRPRSMTNSEAYNLYLRARGFEMQPSLQGVEQSIDLFEHAIGKDPSLAPAYAGIAAGYAARSLRSIRSGRARGHDRQGVGCRREGDGVGLSIG